MPSAKVTGKIDVQHHVYAPIFAKALNDAGGDPSGWYIPPPFTFEADGKLCNEIGVSTAILSPTAPGPEIEPDTMKARALARQINEFSTSIRDQQPEHYGFFASIPSLLDTEGALEEIKYGLDTLHADGVILMTRYGNDNHYLGHQDLTPIWDELNKRKAVVFVHPTHAVDTKLVNKFLPQPAWDYPHETGRTAIDLILSGMLRNHAKDCKIILSHAGGDMPYLIDRPARLMAHVPASMNSGKSTEEILEEATWFYFDTALSSSRMHLKALFELLKNGKEDHVLFGSDYPNAPVEAITDFTTQLEGQGDLLDVQSLRENALKLFPRLRK
jgi:6-methylsalicylate decarboxylase